MSVGDRSCEEAKNADLLVPGKSLVNHNVEGIQRSLNLQTSRCNDLPVQDEICIAIFRYRVHFSAEQNRYMLPWLKRDVPFSFDAQFFERQKKSISDLNEEGSVFDIFYFFCKPSCLSFQT